MRITRGEYYIMMGAQHLRSQHLRSAKYAPTPIDEGTTLTHCWHRQGELTRWPVIWLMTTYTAKDVSGPSPFCILRNLIHYYNTEGNARDQKIPPQNLKNTFYPKMLQLLLHLKINCRIYQIERTHFLLEVKIRCSNNQIQNFCSIQNLSWSRAKMCYS